MIRILWILVFAALLSACSSMAPTTIPTVETPWKDRLQALKNIQSWQLKGKIAVQSAQDSGSATINWTQNHGQYTFSLLGPLGAGSLKLSGKPGAVTMESSDGKHATASSAEQLLAQNWGWNLPVSNLKYWVRGLPVPGSANSQFDSYHRLTRLSQQGWNIQYLSYTTVNGIDLPNKIHIESAALKTKIIIYQWKI